MPSTIPQRQRKTLDYYRIPSLQTPAQSDALKVIPKKSNSSAFTIPTEAAIKTQLRAKFKEMEIGHTYDGKSLAAFDNQTLEAIARYIYSLAKKDSTIDIGKQITLVVESIKTTIDLFSKIKNESVREDIISTILFAYETPSFASRMMANPVKAAKSIESIIDKLLKRGYGGTTNWPIHNFMNSLVDNADFASWVIDHPSKLISILNTLFKIKDESACDLAISAFLSRCGQPSFASQAKANPAEVAESIKILANQLSTIRFFYNRDNAYDLLISACASQDFVKSIISGNFSQKDILFFIRASEKTIELGRPLDDLHDQPEKRAAYLSKLSTDDVITLLVSNPEYFYTSSNHMLFDRLNSDLKKNKQTLTDLLQDYRLFDIFPDLCRNLAFRAINYDRLSDKPNSIFSKDEAGLAKTISLLLEPLNNRQYNANYFYLLANCIDGLKGDFKSTISSKLNEASEKGDNPFNKAVAFLQKYLKGEIKRSGKETIDRINYVNNGKLQILQIFDKEDTAGFNWPDSQKHASKYGQKKQGASGELIYENSGVKVTLYMGSNGEQNQNFIKAFLATNPNAIITFRGHSFSLRENFPSDIFENRKANVLFIPGSCGSAGSVSGYKEENPNTNLVFFSNTSTGRGQVTETILDILAEVTKPTTFMSLLSSNEKRILAAGGDIKTIKVYSLGEQLLDYVAEKK